jgi:hypothetical protein
MFIRRARSRSPARSPPRGIDSRSFLASSRLLYDLIANKKKPDQGFVKGQLIPVTKDNVEEGAKNWDKWLPKK